MITPLAKPSSIYVTKLSLQRKLGEEEDHCNVSCVMYLLIVKGIYKKGKWIWESRDTWPLTRGNAY